MTVIKCGLRLSSITIDADGSPSGYVAWYNHSTEDHNIMFLRPSAKNEKFGVQRMEMLAIFFALADNQHNISKIAKCQKERQIIVNVRSDSKTSIDQLQGISQIRDVILQRIYLAIKKLLQRIPYMIIFNHLDRTRNIAGLLLEQRRRREEEKSLMHQYEKYYGIDRIHGLISAGNSYSFPTT